MLLYKPPDAKDGYEESIFPCEDITCAALLDNDIIHRLKGCHALTLSTRIVLLTVRNCYDPVQATRQYFTTNRTKLALTQLDFPLCCHLRTSNPFIYNHYTPACTEHQALDENVSLCTCSCWKGGSGTARIDDHYRCCPECLKSPLADTIFGFRTAVFEEDGVRTLVLILHLCRDLGELNSCTHLGWTYHTSSSAQTKLLSQQWQRWMEFRRGTIAGWATRPATPIFEETITENTHDEHRSLLSNCMSLWRKVFRPKGFPCTRHDSSNNLA
jgi:hypothetical protein